MTKVIPILSGRCLVVELPDGSEFPRIGNGVLKAERTHNDYSVSLVRLPLPPGNWQMIEMLSRVTEEQAARMVESVDYDDSHKLFSDYIRKEWLVSSILSLESAILAENWYFENPYGEEPTHLEHMRAGWLDNPITSDVRRVWNWKEAQSRVLCRERCLLLRREE